MPLTDRAYFPGDDDHPSEDRPRCTTTSGGGRWECALWDGHGDDPNPRYQPHSWVETGEDD